MMNKEIIKEFLKPDWRKIILTVFVIILFSIQFMCSTPLGGTTSCFSILDELYLFLTHCFFIFGFGILQIIDKYFFLFLIYMISIYIIEFTIIYSFICLIIFVYNKLKRKK